MNPDIVDIAGNSIDEPIVKTKKKKTKKKKIYIVESESSSDNEELQFKIDEMKKTLKLQKLNRH